MPRFSWSDTGVKELFPMRLDEALALGFLILFSVVSFLPVWRSVEVAGMLASSDNPKMARQFLEFMMSDAFQNIIPTTNWMYPSALPKSQLPEGFTDLIDPAPVLLFDDKTVEQSRRAWIDEWLEALSR